MQRNKVGQMRFNDDNERVDITLLNDNNKVVVPKQRIITKNKDGFDILVLKPGDNFNILQDRMGYGFAYIYTGHLYITETPYDCRDFVHNLPFVDRIVFAHALRREVQRRGNVPSLAAYKNLQRIIAERVAVQEK